MLSTQRSLLRIVLVVFGEELLGMVEVVGAGLAEVSMWWRDSFGIAVFAYSRDRAARCDQP
jgi:hypothetical protein